MKKIVTLLLLAICCSAAFAQRSAQPRSGGRTANVTTAKNKHTFFAGLKGGLDLTSMTQPDECDLYDAAGMGFSGGLVAKARFMPATPNAPAGTGLLGVGLELKYKLNKVKTIGTDEDGKNNADMSIGYFEVPVFVQLYPFYRSDAMNTFYIEAGSDFAGTLSRSPKQLTVNSQKGEVSQAVYKLDVDNSKLKGFDVRLMAGVGYDIPIKNSKQETTSLFGVNARYYLGTSKLAKNFASKMNTFEISVSWMFCIGKL